MQENTFNFKGLTTEEVSASREKYGSNKLQYKKENKFLASVKDLVTEPMIILLLIASLVYFISGEIGDGLFLSVAVILVGIISLYQESKSRDALSKLQNITQPSCTVIRNGELINIKSEELVLGDTVMVEEGTSIVADGVIKHSNDFSVNESILTGESLSVFKDKSTAENTIFSGTTVSSGLAIITITAIGNETRLGKIGKSLEHIAEEKSPLEKQINSFVKKMVIAGAIIFLLVWAINFFNSYDFLDSLLKALTLAMSILPEEIPVAFTTFMALGAWQLMKMGVVVKQMRTVESLGGATVICTDKTGTLTENRMSLAKLFTLKSSKLSTPEDALDASALHLIRIAMWASEPIPFDPMEVALHDSYKRLHQSDERPHYTITHEYPLSGVPPMMTHIFENEEGKRIVAAKGAPEAMIKISTLSETERQQITKAMEALAHEGFRVLAVGESDFRGTDFPEQQQALPFIFLGLVAFYDPPKKNIESVLQNFYKAGIQVKIITGDNALTTSTIARQIGLKGYQQSLSGDDIMNLDESALAEKVLDTNMFTRMFPEAKLRIINALKSKGEIVAMTGDGVNDGPALKAAHIGIAMGKKGTEIAKEAASLILVDDDLSKMVDAIAMGRTIYTNLKKALQYIISIHIPIIFTVFIPLALGWIYPNIFSPIHVILLELIMGPTCSIVYQNEPMEKNTMITSPRASSENFFNAKELITSISQGLIITLGVLFIYQLSVRLGYNESLTRAMVFTTLIFSNIFLTLVNRSFYFSIITTMRYKNRLVGLIIGLTLSISVLLLYLPPVTIFFEFEPLNIVQLGWCAGTGFIFVLWYELVKWRKRSRS